jgi:hypothetical protein
MKKLLFFIVGILIAGNAFGQENIDAGRFWKEIMLQPGKVANDSTFINASGTTDETAPYGMWPNLSLDYLFTDDVTSGSVTSTLIFQQLVMKQNESDTQNRWVTIDSLAVTTTSASWRSWVITSAGRNIPNKPIWRISVASRSASADTCRIIFYGWNNQR